MRILDLDLDFFVTPIAHWRGGRERLPAGDGYAVEPLESIERFLIEKCGLNRGRKTIGELFEEHDEVFGAVRALAANQPLAGQIVLDHVDAHSDTGGGFDLSWRYLFTEYVHQPQVRRFWPRRGSYAMNSGNFLIFLSACGWIQKIRFVHHPEWQRDDIQHIYMRNFDSESDYIQLKRYRTEDIDRRSDMTPLNQIPHDLEAAVPFEIVARQNFAAEGLYDRVYLTRSPAFTPRAADAAYDFISEFIEIETRGARI
jgi:hypothetical protein